MMLNAMPETPKLVTLRHWPFLALTHHCSALRDANAPAKAGNTDWNHRRKGPQAFLARQPPVTVLLPLDKKQKQILEVAILIKKQSINVLLFCFLYF
ncbi:MAG: hypothetical protein ACRDBO_17470 [Lachnospiraceae bacterium]